MHFGFTRILLVFTMLFTATESAAKDSLSELDLKQTQNKLLAKQITAQQLLQYYLDRIDSFDQAGPTLNSIAFINPNAHQQAQQLDQKIQDDLPLGALFGAFVVVKDNIDIANMPNTAGSWLMREHIAKNNAFVIQQLLAQDAIILAKTNLSEWANFRSNMSSSGWSSLHGQTLNPHDTTRSPCGSSSGSGAAIAADFGLLGIGTETDGSVTCPAAVNGIVGFKPTLGRISRQGIIPIAHSQDTAGPMARTVTDVAALFNAMQGKDNADSATFAAQPVRLPINQGALKGKRLGIVRNLMGYHPQVDALFEQQVALLQKAGATIIDNANIETRGSWNDSEYLVLLAEFKADLNQYLSTHDAPVKNLADAIAQNSQYQKRTMPFFAQDIFIEAQAAPDLSDTNYLNAIKFNRKQAGELGIDTTLKKFQLDALIAPSGAPAWKIDHVNGDHFLGSASSAAAVSGYPHITVPMGTISGLPVGLSFMSRFNQDTMLIEIAFDYEQLAQARVTPNLGRESQQ